MNLSIKAVNGKIYALLALLITVLILAAQIPPIAVSASAADGNIVAFSGSSLTQNGATIHTTQNADISIGTSAGATSRGSAYYFNPTKAQGGGWVNLPLSGISGTNFASTAGVAMYMKIPSNATRTNFEVRLINHEWTQWASIGLGADITYVSKDGTRTTKTHNYPFENMQGFEGFVFIPYSAFTGGGGGVNGTNVKTTMNAASWYIEIGYYKSQGETMGLNYYFSDIGFYSSTNAFLTNVGASSLVGESEEYLLYDGTSTSLIRYKSGTGFNYESVAKATDKYGYAINFEPTVLKAPGWAKIPLDGVSDFSSTSGVAMYVKFPEVPSTSLDIRLINDAWTQWASIGSNVDITYIPKGGTKAVKKDEIPLEDKSGYEGWVFIPYSAFCASGSPLTGEAAKSQMSASTWNIELSSYRTDEECINKPYYFDNIGIYSNIEKYIEACDKHVEKPNSEFTGGEFILNEGNYGAVSYNGGTDIVAKAASTWSKYGNGMAINPKKTRGSGWAYIPADSASSFDFKGTRGIAMYVRFPSGVTTTNLTIRIIKKDWSDNYCIDNYVQITTIDKLGKETTSIHYSPMENLQGYEGFVFIPFAALSAGQVKRGPNPAVFNNWTNWGIEISHWRLNEDEIGPDYVFDNIGFYTDPQEYIKLVNKKHPNLVVNDGDASEITVTGTKNITVENRASATQFATGVAIRPTALNSTSWASLKVTKSSSYVFDNVKGIAAYVKFPNTATATGMKLRVAKADGSKSYDVGVNASVTLLSSTGTKSTVTQAQAFDNLKGFEGYVFIPFASSVDKSQINSWGNVTIDIGPSMKNAADINVDYIFDNVGFYSNIDEYLALTKFQKQHQYYNTMRDAEGLFLVNNMSATGTIANVSGATAAVTKSTADGNGISIKSTGDFSFAFNNYRKGNETIRTTQGMTFWVKGNKDIANYTFTFTVRDENSGVEVFEFNTADSKYFYYGKDGMMNKITNDIMRLPENFEGSVYVPFSSFKRTSGSHNGYIDPIGISTVTITAKKTTSSVSADFIFDNLTFYASQELIDSMGGSSDPNSFTLRASGPLSAYVSLSGDAIRVYKDMTYKELSEVLSVKGDKLSLKLLNSKGKDVNMSSKVEESFIVAILYDGTIIRKIPAKYVKDDIVGDPTYIIKPGVEGVPDKEIVSSTWVYVESFEDEKPSTSNEPITTKKSAAGFVEISGDKIIVNQRMTVSRFLSAFNIRKDLSASLLNKSGIEALKTETVLDGFTFIIKNADGSELLRFIISSSITDAGTDSSTGNGSGSTIGGDSTTGVDTNGDGIIDEEDNIGGDSIFDNLGSSEEESTLLWTIIIICGVIVILGGAFAVLALTNNLGIFAKAFAAIASIFKKKK